MRRRRMMVLCVLLAVVGPACPSLAQDPQPQGCANCHNGESDPMVPGPPYVLLPQSVDASLDCTGCRASLASSGLGADRRSRSAVMDGYMIDAKMA